MCWERDGCTVNRDIFAGKIFAVNFSHSLIFVAILIV